MKAAGALLLAALLLTVCMAGCVREDIEPISPLGTIPKVLVDYVDNNTKVYVYPLDDYRYTSVRSRIFLGNETFKEKTDNNTYSHYVSTKKDRFTLNITVLDQKKDKKKVYSFEANFTVHPQQYPDALLLISIYNPKGSPTEKKISQSNLPWRTLAERIE
jgi:hypothetical protein